MTPSPGTTTRHLGLDLGATNLKMAVVERAGDAWETLVRDQVPTRSGGPVAEVPDTVVDQLGEVALAAMAGHGPIASIGIGVPGLYDPATGATRFLVNVPGPWAGHPVAAPVRAATGLPTALINDARAFGLAELRLGAGRGVRSMIGFTLGTGIGGVVAIDGQVIQGHDGTAGELGHQTLVADGPPCGCGNRGCLEALARADRVAAACGTPTAEAAVMAARSGDATALAGLASIGRWLGIGVANMIAALTPDRVVIGGGIASAGDLILEPLRAELRARVRTTDLDAMTVVPAELGTWAGAIGAAIHGAERAAAVEAVTGEGVSGDAVTGAAAPA